MNTPLPSPQNERELPEHVQRPVVSATELPVLPSAALLRGQKAVAIDHNGLLYRLQTTRQGKLILTK